LFEIISFRILGLIEFSFREKASGFLETGKAVKEKKAQKVVRRIADYLPPSTVLSY
jgi:hypothetical protein